ncbi:DUF4231 domain-containing protein [Mycoplasmopsis gallopavonis]|uniref:Uncharacterized protein n=1 Tax=Mycoplasmopsis gallopavonis TaxID=76629 RepID=A0A449B013_9BACT|nr:DUF4231 domain-containing protein [Mycoplasmopsis gallopavonis]RIV16318.1 DUF4231 domain-containing protein [Mycoplasmopsis gallopavonis]VEU73108.1 Uncharacterised protein [Mycoplasmopsis gallopavonis]
MSKSYASFLKIKKRLTIQIIIYGFFYYLFNLTTIFAAFYVGLLAILFLAGANKNYPENIKNPYFDPEFLNYSGTYVIITTWINSITGLLTGLLSFFMINNRFKSRKIKLKKIQFEELVFRGNVGNYKLAASQSEREYMLYKRCVKILDFDRFTTTNLQGEI